MRTHILVAGFDYEFKGVDFRLLCDNRRKRTVAANKSQEDLRFVTIDFRQGKIETREVTYPSGKKTESVSDTTPPGMRGVTKADFETFEKDGETHRKLRRKLTGLLSIQNVYSVIQGLGSSDPHSVREFSIFSHGFIGGPVLLNSDDDEAGGSARDPEDRDPRAAKDFVAPTMDASALKRFRDAFHPDGYSWFWGCTFPRPTHAILSKVESSKGYGAATGDDAEVELDLNREQAEVLASWLSGLVAIPTDGRRKVRLKFKYVKHYFCVRSSGTYTQTVAWVTGVKAFGALVGTYSDYDKGSLPLMHVPATFGRHARFYRDHLGIELDPEGRRYGLFDPGFTCVAPAAEVPPPSSSP